MSVGFDRKTRVEIVDDMKAKAKNLFGNDVNLAINSPLGILIQLFSYPLSLLWLALEKIYNAMSYKTATGQDLDNRAKNIGITRHPAAKATGEVEFTGDEGVNIPEGYILETDSDPAIQFETTEEVTIDSTGTAIAEIVAVEAGSSGNVSANTITEIVNPISGLDSVKNPNPSQGGRNRETDSELRLRYEDSLDRPGGSTANSIRANILERTEASNCLVLENVNNIDNANGNGLPAKSFEAVVLGGVNQDIAESIFEKKPAGMEAYGGISNIITDDAGLEKTVAFSRATKVDIYVSADIETNSNYPSGGDNQVIDEIIDYIGGINTEGDSVTGLNIGQDVIRNKIISLVYNIDGVFDVNSLTIGVDSTSLSANNISIGFREVSRSETSFIEVIS